MSAAFGAIRTAVSALAADLAVELPDGALEDATHAVTVAFGLADPTARSRQRTLDHHVTRPGFGEELFALAHLCTGDEFEELDAVWRLDRLDRVRDEDGYTTLHVSVTQVDSHE